MQGYTRAAPKGKMPPRTCGKLKSKYERKYLSDDSRKDAEWDRWRANSQQTQVMLGQGDELDILRYAERMEQCARSLVFALEANCEGEVQYRLRNVQFCKFRHCSVCQARRSRRNYVKFLKNLPNLRENSPGARWIFLTLTVPNVPIENLRDELVAMSKAWNKLLLRKAFKNVLAWVRSVEVTKDKKRNDYAHPHFHVLLMVKSTYFARDNYITREKWRQAWRSCKRDESIVAVDVRIADYYRGRRLHGYDLIKSVSELLKYSVKTSDMLQSRAWLIALIRQVYKMRFLAAGGLLKGVFAEKLSNEQMIHAEEVDSADANLIVVEQDDVTKVDDAQVALGLLRYWWRPLEERYSRRVKIQN